MTFTCAGKEKFIIDHTGVEDKFGGKGYAKELVMAGVDFARENDLKIIPLCPYAKSRFDRDKSIGDVLA
ncbi:GNAT family N-acetyltransferase [Gelidibacter sp.]|uniref:GNAT family N-acetyltransferase n=1 Tax=Gelidibacter sp. TaxID=2018083 RepID=UPI003267E55E